jgi:hypothetical protein
MRMIRPNYNAFTLLESLVVSQRQKTGPIRGAREKKKGSGIAISDAAPFS